MKQSILILFLGFFGSVYGQINLGIPVDSSGYHRLIDFEGKLLTPWVRLDDLTYASDLKTLLAKQGTKWGIVNDSLSFVVQPKYDSIFPVGEFIFAESLFRLDIYKDNKLLHSIEDYESFEFDVKLNYEVDYVKNRFKEVHSDVKFIIKTLNGVYITDTAFVLTEDFKFDDAFFLNDIIYTRRGTKFGFVSFDGVQVQPTFQSISMFNATVVELMDDSNQRHYFFQDGTELPLSDSILQYESNNGYYKIYQNGKANLYGSDLKPVVNYGGQDIFNLSTHTEFPGNWIRSTNYFAFKNNHKVGVCDEKGNVVLQPNYRQIFYAGTDRFIVTKDSLYGLVDANGTYLIDPIYTFIETPDYEFLRVHNGNKKGIITKDGKLIVPVDYDEVYCQVAGILTLKNGKFGFYTFDGKQILTNDWYQVYRLVQDSYEMVKYDGTRCIVNKHGLLTPINCENVYMGRETLKYYTANTIVVIPFENGQKLDSTIYPKTGSIVVNRDHIRQPMNINTFDCVTYRNQLNGKIGSKAKNKIGDAVAANYDNDIDIQAHFVKELRHTEFYLAGNKFETKEIVRSFFGEGCSTYGTYLFYLRPDELGYWHSTDLDGCYSVDYTYNYAAQNNVITQTPTAMLVRQGFSAISLTRGELNLQAGQFFENYRTYYQSMNSLHNLQITDATTFGLLSGSPPIYVADPTWQVISIYEQSKTKLRGSFEYYQRLESGAAIFSTDGYLFGIWFEGGENIAEEIFAKIIPVEVGGIQYYLVNRQRELIDGTAISEWTIYDNTGQVLPNYYDAVQVKNFGFFEVQLNGQRFILDKSGKAIYTYL